jgi:2-polyprenyl-6-methoxyphenol hydroxylase-like FAD-dependent oxidoreductase
MGSTKPLTIGIAGAGSAGLFLALLLQKQGHRVYLFERGAQLRCDGCGLLVIPQGLKAISACGDEGLITELINSGKTVSRYVFRNLRGEIIKSSLATVMPGDFPPLLIHRKAIMEALYSRLDPDILHVASNVSGWKNYDGGVEVSFTDGKCWRGDLLIGADGIFSKVAPSVAPERKLNYLGDRVWRGVVEDDCFCTDGEFFVYARGRGVYANSFDIGVNEYGAPITHWGFFHEEPLPANRADQKRMLLEPVPTDLLAKIPDDIARVIKSTPVERVLANWSFDIDPLPRLVNGRGVLIGDAAHAMSSSQASGMTTGWEDCVVLAQHLESCVSGAAGDIDTAIASYNEIRLPEVHQRQVKSRDVSAKIGRQRKAQVRKELN